MECSFRSLEFVNAMYVGKGVKVPMPKLSENTYSRIKQVLDKGVRAEKGLGKQLQGILRPIVAIQKKDRFELGYKPDKRERQRFIEEKRKRESPTSSGKRKEVQKWRYHR